MKKPRIFRRREPVAPEPRRIDPAMCSRRAVGLALKQQEWIAQIRQRAGNDREPRDRPENQTEE
ncbi:MAG: hypothetical protein Q7S95_02145 [bacterium]|nr:hypothetical protein [bacterium]